MVAEEVGFEADQPADFAGEDGVEELVAVGLATAGQQGAAEAVGAGENRHSPAGTPFASAGIGELTQCRQTRRSEQIGATDQDRALGTIYLSGDAGKNDILLAGEVEMLTGGQRRQRSRQPLRCQGEMRGGARERYRARVEDRDEAAVARCLADGQRQHRRFGDGIDAGEDQAVAAADLVEAAHPAFEFEGGAGGTVAVRMRVEGNAVGAELGRPTLEERRPFEGGARRGDKGDGVAAVLADGGGDPAVESSEGLRPGDVATADPGYAQTLGMIGVTVAEAAAVADEEAVDLAIDTAAHPLQLAQAGAGDSGAAQGTMRAD